MSCSLPRAPSQLVTRATPLPPDHQIKNKPSWCSSLVECTTMNPEVPVRFPVRGHTHMVAQSPVGTIYPQRSSCSLVAKPQEQACPYWRNPFPLLPMSSLSDGTPAKCSQNTFIFPRAFASHVWVRQWQADPTHTCN